MSQGRIKDKRLKSKGKRQKAKGKRKKEKEKSREYGLPPNGRHQNKSLNL